MTLHYTENLHSCDAWTRAGNATVWPANHLAITAVTWPSLRPLSRHCGHLAITAATWPSLRPPGHHCGHLAITAATWPSLRSLGHHCMRSLGHHCGLLYFVNASERTYQTIIREWLHSNIRTYSFIANSTKLEYKHRFLLHIYFPIISEHKNPVGKSSALLGSFIFNICTCLRETQIF